MQYEYIGTTSSIQRRVHQKIKTMTKIKKGKENDTGNTSDKELQDK